MKTQSELIGEHPSSLHFSEWLTANDKAVTTTQRHRELIEITSRDEDRLIEWMARNLIKHHYSDFRLNRLKEMYTQIGFPEYAKQHRKLPIVDKVKKGNAIEIILTEYIESCLGKPLIKVFKLKYNPNVDQAIKGDDTLMVDQILIDGQDSIRIFLGESKFRAAPDKAVIEDIYKSLAKEKRPLSYSFLVEEIAKKDNELALKLDKFIIEEIKSTGNLIYTGLLFSNLNTSRFVDTHLISDNESLVFISMNIEKPGDFIDKIFAKAEEIISNPEKL